MRKLIGLLVATTVAIGMVLGAVASASPSQTYSGPYFGDGNLPPGCIRSMSPDNPNNKCFHMRTGLNALDSSQIDVLILVPASPAAERDTRIIRQAVEMWEGGIDYLASQMKMPWLTKVDFHIAVDAAGNLDTYPVYDPEIVIVATNPAGGIGIGVDPTQLLNELEIYNTDGVPCHNIENPFAFETWEAMPGFDSHHGQDEGVYVEDCGGAGGNVCFAIDGAIDPVPGTTDVFAIFDLVTHEFGHCLTIGHVGDGAEGAWVPVPTNDIMSYSEDPPGRSKCVSTLDIEGFALRMSHYLDRNRDKVVNHLDFLDANDLPGDGSNPFQVQSPSDHLYATQSGSPLTCPQPDVGLLPGEPVDWSPTPVVSSRPELKLRSPKQKSSARQGTIKVAGAVSYVPKGPRPRKSTASFVDRSGDAKSPFNDVKKLTASVTDSSFDAIVSLAQLWPTTSATSVAAYSVIINGHRFDSFIPPGESAVMTWDNGREIYLPGASSWNEATNSVRFHLSRRYLERFGITAPYWVGSQASVQSGKRMAFVDDTAPAGQARIGVTGRPLVRVKPQGNAFNPPTGTKPYTVDFKAETGNTFAVSSTNLGQSLVADNHLYSMDVRSPSNVEVTLNWSDDASDLDLSVMRADEDTVYADAGKPEKVVLKRVKGLIDFQVAPFMVGPTGTAYTLKAKVTPIGKDSDHDGLTDPGDQCVKKAGPAPTGCPDRDRDGVPDKSDACAKQAGTTANGCPVPATEWIKVYVDGTLKKKVRVDRVLGSGTFGLKVPVAHGAHRVRIVWLDRSGVLDATTRRVR